MKNYCLTIVVLGLLFIAGKLWQQRRPRTFGFIYLIASIVLFVSGRFFVSSSPKPVVWTAEENFGMIAIIFFSAHMALLGSLYVVLGARLDFFVKWLKNSERGEVFQWVLAIACGLSYFAATLRVMFWIVRLI